MTRIPCFLSSRITASLVPPDWHLDIKSGVIAELLPKFECLANHFARLEREDLNAQRNCAFVALQQFDDLPDVQAEVGALLLRHDRRVSGDTRGKTPLKRILDLVQVGAVYENLHK